MSDGKTPPRGRPPEHVRVTIRQRQRGHDPLDEDVIWPKGWPIPDSGAIVNGSVVGGWVEHVEFDVVARRILVVLR